MIGILLAAGRGTRMKNDFPKVLFDINDEPLCFGPFRALLDVCEKVIVVVGYRGADVKAALLERAADLYPADLLQQKILFYTQEEQKGTGDAVRTAFRGLGRGVAQHSETLVVNGDLPLVRKGTLDYLIKRARQSDLAAVCLSASLRNPAGLGRILRSEMGAFQGIREEKDASPGERRLHEVNGGIYYFKTSLLVDRIEDQKNQNEQNEFYLTDLLQPDFNRNHRTEALQAPRPMDILGVNTTYELAKVRRIGQMRLQKRLCEEWGVDFVDPLTAYVSARTRFTGACRIGPGVLIQGRCTIESGVVLQGQNHLLDCHVGAGARLLWGSVVHSSKVGPRSSVGPMAHLRPGCETGTDVKIGNFVEIKKTRIGNHSKASHLSYLGDADIGEDSNIGAGTITCNFDGFNKYKTVIGDRAFVGSDTQLVAPVNIGDEAYIGSGTTVTQDVPAGALAISRVEMVIKEGYAQKLAAKRAAAKEMSKD